MYFAKQFQVEPLSQRIYRFKASPGIKYGSASMLAGSYILKITKAHSRTNLHY